MTAENMSSPQARGIDPRVYLFMLLAGAVFSMLATSEAALLALFCVALVFQAIGGRAGKIPGYLLSWAVMWGIAQGGLALLRLDPSMGLGITLSNLGLSAHRAFVPLLFAMLLYRMPVGSCMAALNAMRLPKAVGIGMGIMLRFFPTVAQEYRAIRNAQKFRGVGLGFWHTLAHLPENLSCILLPLVIRITRISEELSASVTVRGVRFHNDVISFRPVRFSPRDALLLAGGIAACTCILLVNRLALGVGA